MRIGALVVRIIRQFLRDKRTLALMLAAPLLVLTLMSLVFHSSTYAPKIGAVGLPDALTDKLKEAGASVTAYDRTKAYDELAAGRLDAVIEISGGKPAVKLEGSDPSHSRAVTAVLQKALLSSSLFPAAPAQAQPVFTYLHGSADMTAFDSFGPVMIGFFAFFFVFLIAGVSFLRERTTGTLERLLASPLRRWEIVAGYTAGFGIFTMLQTALIVWFSIRVLGLMMAGSFWLVLLITMLLSLTALSLGTLLSAYAATEFQMIQFIPIVIVPQVFFSGLFNMDAMVPWLRAVGRVLPLTYGAEAIRDVMLRGSGWPETAGSVGILLAFTAVFLLLNVLALRKHRKI
jgi:ABC-2 type transport system permease protein